MAGKVGHPGRLRREAATFGRLVEAERAAGVRIGEAMKRVWERDKKRWGSSRKRDDLWAEYKKIRPQVAALESVAEALMADLEALHEIIDTADLTVSDVQRRFPRMSARSANWLETTADIPRQRAHALIDKIESEFARDPLLADWREVIKAKRRPE
jgi:hypothetical protein